MFSATFTRPRDVLYCVYKAFPAYLGHNISNLGLIEPLNVKMLVTNQIHIIKYYDS